MVATRHRWLDAAVLDAHDQPMPFSIFDGVAIAPFQSSPLKCSLQAAQDSSNLVYRCLPPQPVENVYGVRVRGPISAAPRAQLKLAIRDQYGALLATYDGEAGRAFDIALAGTPIAFSGLHRIAALDLEMMSAGQEVADVRLVTAPATNIARWHRLQWLQASADGKSFIYAVDFPLRVDNLRFTLTQPLPPSARLQFGGCHQADCAGSSSVDYGAADALALGPDNPSFPVRLGLNGSSEPFLHVIATVALAKAPDVEMGWIPPKLIFHANGSQPYTFAVGQTTVPPNARYNFTRDMFPAGKPDAQLAPYSATNRFESRLIDLVGPLILILALLLAAFWVYGPRRGGTRAD